MSQIFLVATATVFLSASINVMPIKFVSRLHRWKYLWSMCNATVGCKLLSGEKLRREVCELKDTSDFFNVCTAKFAPAQLLLSSSLRIFEMTSDFGQNSNRNFFGRLVASSSRSARRHRRRPPATQKFCAVQNGWGSPASVTRVSVKCINVSRAISCCSGDKEGGKNFDSHTHSHATVAESLYGLQGALVTLGALPGASHSWSWLLKKRLPLLVTHDSV